MPKRYPKTQYMVYSVYRYFILYGFETSQRLFSLFLYQNALDFPPLTLVFIIYYVHCCEFHFALNFYYYYSTITLPQTAPSFSIPVNDIVPFPESLSPLNLKLNMSCSCSALWFIESTVSREICVSFRMNFSVDCYWTLLHCGESRKKTLLFVSGWRTKITV